MNSSLSYFLRREKNVTVGTVIAGVHLDVHPAELNKPSGTL